MPFLREISENSAIHTSLGLSDHIGLTSLLSGASEKLYLTSLTSWLFGSKNNINNLADNALSSWLIGEKELRLFSKG